MAGLMPRLTAAPATLSSAIASNAKDGATIARRTPATAGTTSMAPVSMVLATALARAASCLRRQTAGLVQPAHESQAGGLPGHRTNRGRRDSGRGAGEVWRVRLERKQVRPVGQTGSWTLSLACSPASQHL